MWFSYDPEVGMEFHESEDDARGKANENLEFHRDCAADDGWSSNMHKVCWGKVVQSAVETARWEDDSGRFDYMCEWELRNED